MKYEKAQDILPKDILQIVQQYMDGGYLYIPRKDENRKVWGENSGAIKELDIRNKKIFMEYSSGKSVKELANIYFLSEASIRRVIRLFKNTSVNNEKYIVDN